MPRHLKLACALAAACVYAGPGIAGDAYPSRPVKIIIPLGPGNSLEIATRLVADRMGRALGQPFVIEAQPGAAGQIGAEHVARAPADGYTLLAANDGIITMLPNLQKNLGFAPLRDFAPITKMVGIPFVLIAHPSVQAKTAPELVALAKAQPGKLEYSSGGNGSAQQMAMELFMRQTGTSFLHVPYKGAPQAAMEVVSGRIPVALAGLPIVASLIKQGRLRALGLASEKRLSILADTPTLAEQGIALNFETWGGLFAPSGTPAAIVEKLNREAVAAIRSDDVQARIAELGFRSHGDPSERFAESVKADYARMAQVIKAAGIQLQ
jgi:tripartite-type tricarboxylate transporter receptor subunit TctC